MKKFILLFTGIYFTVMSTATAVVPFVIGGMALAEVAAALVPIMQPIAQEAIEKKAREIHGAITGKKCPTLCRDPALVCKAAAGLTGCKGNCQKIRSVGGYELRVRFGKDGEADKEWSLAACVRQGIQAYDLLLMSKLPKDGIPKNGKIYLEKDGTKLKYTVIAPDNKVVKDTLDINIPKELTSKVLNTFKSQILEETSKRAHTIRSGVGTQGKGNTRSIAVYSEEDLDDLLSLIALQMAARKIVNTKGRGVSDKALKKAKMTREEIVADAEDLVNQITGSIKENVEKGVYGNQ